ncbi:MAG: menaquinol-cytochrome c reductase cytochrome b subunit [Acidimicrobiia bacterium]
MGEIPEHLLKRAAERKAQLAAEAGADNASSETAAAQAETTGSAATEGQEAVSQEASSAPAIEIPELTGIAATVPRHLIERSYNRRAVLSGAAPAAATGSASAAPATPAGAPPAGAPAMTGPEGHTHRLLTVVKSGSIQQTKAEAQDKVHTWPHLLSIEFGSMLIVTAGLFLFSMFVRAPLLGLADINQTPNPSKAPWYFLGLQELLTMFHPMVAGVTIPGVALVLLALTPYYDKNPDNNPEKRKYAIAMMTIFLIFWAVLVIIGSFFRGQGFNFVFPMKDGVYFEL